MHEKEPQKPPEHTSEHVKSQHFLAACPQPPLTQSILWGPTFVFALGPPPNPLGGPGEKVWKWGHLFFFFNNWDYNYSMLSWVPTMVAMDTPINWLFLGNTYLLPFWELKVISILYTSCKCWQRKCKVHNETLLHDHTSHVQPVAICKQWMDTILYPRGAISKQKVV